MPVITYNLWHVVLQITNQIEGGIPKDRDLIRTWLETKGVSKKDVYRETVAAMGKDAETGKCEEVAEVLEEKNWCGFKQHGTLGLFIEARCIKAAFKEAGNVTKKLLVVKWPGLKQAKARIAEKLWVFGMHEDEVIELGTDKPTGDIERVVHAMGRTGPIHSLKRTDYVKRPKIEFFVETLNDGTIPGDAIVELLWYMAKNGIGANRSQGAGRFKVVSVDPIPDWEGTGNLPNIAKKAQV